MAEIKLGRIKFIWKGNWSSGIEYFKDDIVRNGGNTYVCVARHVSTDFALDEPGSWNTVSEGQEWRGNWEVSTLYRANDIVKYNGLLYIANTEHTSIDEIYSGGLTVDSEKWDLYGESFEYTGNWQTTYVYRLNDLAKYNGITYRCIEEHTSTDTELAGLEVQQDKWEEFVSSIYWMGSWTASTRYKINDAVKYGGQIYLCNTGHRSADTIESGLELDQEKWTYFHKGIEYKGDWETNLRYKVNDVVKYGGGIWICTIPHTSSQLFTTDVFEQFVEGLEFEDSWSHTKTYQAGDIVTFGGYSYIAKFNNTNQVPSISASVWDFFTAGFRFRGEWGEDSSLQDYFVGDVVSIGSYTYLCILDNQNVRPPDSGRWLRLNSGIYWKQNWTSGQYYDTGDAVAHQKFSYICIASHTADEISQQNRPDQTTGFGNAASFWDLLGGGTESKVVTTSGDLLYYSGVGPARIPIGEVGQVLAVDSQGQFPEWKYLGTINNVYYVEGTTGTDLPAPVYGTTLNQPWKTVRYAAEQVDLGPMLPNARYLLETNKSFIQNAVVEWVNDRIADGTGIWAGFTNTNIESCRRDIGLIIDAIIWDMGHGGNARTRLATLSYFDEAGALIPEIADEYEQLVAALESMRFITEYIISNLDYVQVSNSFAQFKDTTIVKEFDAQEKIDNLVSIIKTTLTDTNLTNLPKEYKPNNTIFVKTGIFEEILPIIVPENTAVVGDELRSTKIVPKGKVTHPTDSYYSKQTLLHMKSIISDVIINTSITPTTGNNESQYLQSPPGTVGSQTNIDSIVNNSLEIKDILNNGTTNADAITFTDPGVDANKLNARVLLQLNKTFIVNELTTWINAQISGNIAPFTSSFTYDVAKCERDVAYIVDALSYDVQYDCEWAVYIMAESYFVGAVSSLPAGEVDETVAAYEELANIVSDIVVENYAGQVTNGLPASFTESGTVDSGVHVISDAIQAGGLDSLPGITYPDVTWASSEAQIAHANMLSAKTSIQQEVVAYIKKNNYDLAFNQATCYRDAGYMVDALAYDMAFATNYQSILVGISYYRGTSSSNLVLAEQLDVTIDAVDYIAQKLQLYAPGGPGLAAEIIVQNGIDYIDYYINNIGLSPIVAGTNYPITDTNYTYAVENIEKNRKFLVEEMDAYIDVTFSDTVTATTAGQNTITISDTSWLQIGTAIKFTGTGTVDAGLTENLEYYVLGIVDGTNFKITESRDSVAEINLDTSSSSFTVALSYSSEFCLRDVNKYIDALKFDLVYVGNYKTLTASQYYVNAVTGSKLLDMFYMRNASGLRNCTLQGLDGRSDGDLINTQISGLTNVGPSGTQRPLAGAFVSLDPGFNPTDERTWILTRSPYIQNVTTFGDACTGMKVDGEIHAGGNDSIVANDFTQIISDGIGFWVSNLGRSELVSVFTYYCHVGYLAESGGKVRATNGNNSYGLFGSVSEGVDNTEVAITGKVDNRAFTATIQRVIASGQDIIAIEYLNAGVNYTPAGTTMTVSGTGYGALIGSVNTVNQGVYEVRMLDLDDSSGKFGGEGYYFATNNAQEGNTTQIRLANTETGLASNLITLAIYIVSGKGAGQYGVINTYNPTTKLADIVKASDGTPGWDQMIPGRAIESLLDATSVYWLEPLVIFSGSDQDPADYSLRAKGRAIVEAEQVIKITIYDPGTGYSSPPTVTLQDPNNTSDAPTEARIGSGILTQPTWINRGLEYDTATVEINGDGYADFYQPGALVQVNNLTDQPKPGSNVEFANLPNTYYKLVAVRQLTGSGQFGLDAPFSCQLQISPSLEISEAPDHAEDLEMRIRYSQIRLTGHDFLDIGTGNFATTNYPGLPLQEPDPEKETVEYGGGRVFYTSTDQDGNFRVGKLFSVEQATGVATLNADAFNLSGLQELSLGELGLGSQGAVINEFSTDATFTADSDSIVPTQKAIKAYITSQIGGGASTLNVNSITAGEILIVGTSISTTTNNQIVVNQKMNFTKGVDGVPIAMNYYLKS